MTSAFPQEEMSFDVTFKPTSTIHYDVYLTIRTTMNHTYKVHVVGQGVEPPLFLSRTILKLAASCPGDVVSHDVFLSNRTKQEQVRRENTQTQPHIASCRLDGWPTFHWMALLNVTPFIRHAPSITFPQCFEFAIPRPLMSQLRIAPVIGVVPPERSRRVTVWFCPSPDEDPLNHHSAASSKQEEDSHQDHDEVRGASLLPPPVCWLPESLLQEDGGC